jgi:hypothetical protein
VRVRALLPLLLIGCRIPPTDPVEHPQPTLTTPALTAVQWSCDDHAERWQLDVSATSWTAGATLWLSVNQRYIEQHTVPSVAHAPDGSLDELRLRLDMEADWRAVNPGSSTAFSCLVRPNGTLIVWDPDGQAAACALFDEGVQHPDVPDCIDPFDEVDET